MAQVEGYQVGLIRSRTGDLRVRDASDGRRVIALLADGKERVCKLALTREAEAELRSQLRPLPAPPVPPPAPAPTPVPGGKATLQPVGYLPPADSVTAAKVARNGFEPRPQNYPQNKTVPTADQLASYHNEPANKTPVSQYVTGNFTGTTDEIIQWAAHKWGFPEDEFRAIAAIESWWDQRSGYGYNVDPKNDGGLFNNTAPRGTGNLLWDSTGFAADLFGMSMRYYFNGHAGWLNDVGEQGRPYTAGDMWGCFGAHFSGRWWTEGSVWYIERIKNETLGPRVWERPGF